MRPTPSAASPPAKLVEFNARPGFFSSLYSRALRPLERLLSIDLVNQTYAAATGAPDWNAFVQRVLEHLNVSYKVMGDELARIPRTGPLVVVANHPFGCIEGIILASLLSRVRPDVRIMANHLLQRIPEMRDLFVFVDPFGGPGAARANVRPLRQSLRVLEAGGVLGVFPAGEVSHLNLSTRSVADPEWNPMIGRIIRKAECPVLPVYFDGRNSAFFQFAGLLHKRLRTALLAREIFNKRDQRLSVRIGSAIPFSRLKETRDDAGMVEHLRQRTYLLAHKPIESPRPTPAAIAPKPVIDPVAPALLSAEVASLAPSALLCEAGDLAAYATRAEAVPHLLREIGRLREITFRATGEGTGKSLDLDRFDPNYIHLFVWNRAKTEVVGAYRLGPTDELLKLGGVDALYTHTLFAYRRELLDRMGPALEMGRSFIRQEYQRGFQSLLLLWKGIGHFCVRHPRYKILFGPVSISNTYQSISRQLMVQFFRTHYRLQELAELVRPRNPFRAGSRPQTLPGDAEDLSDAIADLEPDHKGIPVLLRQYLKLGARLVDFNVDPDFSDVLDALVYVDLTRTDGRTLDRYMTRPGRASFMAHHGLRA